MGKGAQILATDIKHDPSDSLRRPFHGRLARAQAHTGARESMGRIRATLLSRSSEIPLQMMLMGYHSSSVGLQGTMLVAGLT